jgi:hypothetical protein
VKLLQWTDSYNPTLRMASYNGHNYYLSLKIRAQFKIQGFADGDKTPPLHAYFAEAVLLSDENSIGLKTVESAILGEMKSNSRSDLLEWVEPGQEWAESLLISPMERLVRQLGGTT